MRARARSGWICRARREEVFSYKFLQKRALKLRSKIKKKTNKHLFESKWQSCFVHQPKGSINGYLPSVSSFSGISKTEEERPVFFFLMLNMPN